MRRITPAAVLLAGLLGLVTAPARAQDASLGGGSDIRSGTVVEVAAGTVIPPLHHVFADNPDDQPIEVEFRAEAPPGVEITPAGTQFRIAPGDSVTVPFAISVDEVVAPGDHPVTVQLLRSDIDAEPGQITNIPAIGTTFTLRVVGEAATITVRSRSEQSGHPVAGTLTLAAVTGPAATFEVARVDGTELSARVAPGSYRAAYLLAGRELASADTQVSAGATEQIVLEVRSVSFVLVSARPVKEDGKVVVADLVASVENHLQPLEGPVALGATVLRDGQEVDSIVLDELDGLPIGVTEATLTYRPPEGFPQGTYRFEFTLTTPEFTLTGPEEPSFTVAGNEPFPLLLPQAPARPVRSSLARPYGSSCSDGSAGPVQSRGTALEADRSLRSHAGLVADAWLRCICNVGGPDLLRRLVAGSIGAASASGSDRAPTAARRAYRRSEWMTPRCGASSRWRGSSG